MMPVISVRGQRGVVETPMRANPTNEYIRQNMPDGHSDSRVLQHAGLLPVCYASIDELGKNNGFNIIALDDRWAFLLCVMRPLS